MSGFKRFSSQLQNRHTVSSILFALVHTPTDIGSFVIYWGMGLALSWVYLRTGRFEAAVLTHFIWNVLGILML